MATSKFSLFENLSEFEDSLMRSVLIFGFVSPKSKKNDQFRKAILSIIIYGKGEYDVRTVTSIFNNTFHLNQKEEDIQHQVNILMRDGYIEYSEQGHYSAIDTDRRGESYFDKIEKDTAAMLSRVVDKVNKRYPLSTGQKEVVNENAKQALSLYYQINGMAVFGLQDPQKLDELNTVVEVAQKNLDSRIGKHLISVLAYTIEEPGEDKDILNIWAKTVVGMRSTGIDPMLRNFKQQQLASKKFVLDTDVMLNALAKNARYSDDYHKIIGYLVKGGAEVLIPQFVYEEVVTNADNAIRKFAARGNNYVNYPNESLEDKKSNVFIEDYVKTIRKEPRKKGMAFETYIGNIYSERSPYTLNQNVTRLLGEKNGKKRYELKENVLNEEKATQLKEIIKERAMKTPKGWGRTLEQQEEMALNDTKLYLTICDENVEKEKSGILGYQCYLVTRSTRTIKSATDLGIYEKHVVCHPQALISILDDIGQIGDVEIINLFENPFLTYTTELIMDQAGPVMEAGAQIGYYDFIQLREKFDLNINEILTAQGAEMKQLVDKYTKAGLLFAKDWDDILKEKDVMTEKLTQALARNETLERKTEKLEKQNDTLKGRVHYLEQRNGGVRKKNKSLKEKREGRENR